MNKILVSVKIPSVEQNFDMFIPINRKVGTVKKYVVKSISELSKGIFRNNKDYIFFDIDTGIKYPNNVYVKDSGMKNGARIMIL